MNAFPTVVEKREQDIKRAAIAGAMLSRYCRNSWTGERIRVMLEREKVQYANYLVAVSTLGDKPLLGYSNCAGLDCFYLGRQDQHLWDAERWEAEIRAII
jgi:hypothetical protein